MPQKRAGPKGWDMSLSTGRAIALGAVAGAIVVGGGWFAHAHSGGGGSDPASPVRVTACTPGQTLTMTLAATNPGADVVTYSLIVYWFKSDGGIFNTQNITTDPIEPGHTITVHAGNSADSEDYQHGLTCRVRVTDTN